MALHWLPALFRIWYTIDFVVVIQMYSRLCSRICTLADSSSISQLIPLQSENYLFQVGNPSTRFYGEHAFQHCAIPSYELIPFTT